MKLEKGPSIDAAIRTLSEGDRQKVFAWFTHLGNWENDPFTREHARPTAHDGIYVLSTADEDIWIFFRLDEANNQITVLDIAKPSRVAIPAAG